MEENWGDFEAGKRDVVRNVVPNVCLGCGGKAAALVLSSLSPSQGQSLLDTASGCWGISDEILPSLFYCIQPGNFLVLACRFLNASYYTRRD